MYSDSEQEIINQYMKRVSSVKLLTPQEEKELAKKAKAGDKEALKSFGRSKPKVCGKRSKAVYGIWHTLV
jgi:Sigma-70 factor, region 1.